MFPLPSIASKKSVPGHVANTKSAIDVAHKSNNNAYNHFADQDDSTDIASKKVTPTPSYVAKPKSVIDAGFQADTILDKFLNGIYDQVSLNAPD